MFRISLGLWMNLFWHLPNVLVIQVWYLLVTILNRPQNSVSECFMIPWLGHKNIRFSPQVIQIQPNCYSTGHVFLILKLVRLLRFFKSTYFSRFKFVTRSWCLSPKIICFTTLLVKITQCIALYWNRLVWLIRFINIKCVLIAVYYYSWNHWDFIPWKLSLSAKQIFTGYLGNLSPWNSLPSLLFILLLFKAMVFPVVMYGWESWTVKKAECRRIDAFELWCWRRLMRVLWTARKSNQSILKEISSGCSLEGLMLKLKLQYFGHLMRRVDSLENTLMLGGIGGRRRRGRQRMRWLDGITDSMDVSLSWWWTGRPGVLPFMGLQSWTWLSDWTKLNWTDPWC